MEKLKQYKYIIILVLVILGLAFYWFQLRPALTRKECASNPFKYIGTSGYERCLRQHGLNK
jgi:hypothetical protein